MIEFQKIYIDLAKNLQKCKNYVKFASYLHKSYNRFKNNVGISKNLCKTCKRFTKLQITDLRVSILT